MPNTIDRDVLERELKARINANHMLAKLSGSKSSTTKFRSRAHELSEFLGWMRKQPDAK